jgi:hypothetical protein
MAGLQLSGHYQRTRESIIKLSDPQVRLLDALTEAVGIPHQRGQTVIEIPKNLKGDKKEFLELVAFSKKQGRYP